MAARKTITFHTFGCKLNYAETSTIARHLPQDVYQVSENKSRADVFIIHSCAVTASAEKKCNQLIRHLKRENPSSTLIVMGCYAQLNSLKLNAMPEVDMVLGNMDKFSLAEHLYQLEIMDNMETNEHPGTSSQRFIPSFSLGDRTRSFLKIQDGCDYFCSYCTIPHARGHSRSASVAEVLTTAREIAGQGVNEIVLTGVNIGDFGKSNGESFLELLQVLEVSLAIPRIRISSIEPDLLTDEIITLVASSGKLMPHFHIPLQSGSNRILHAMKRKYQRELFADKTGRIKSLIPHCCIAADVITGFPGETEEDFTDTCKFVEGLDISYLHVFTYSERPDTLSAKLENKVPPEIKKHRSRILHNLSLKKKDQFYENNKGRTFHVLFESDPEKEFLFGFTENYIHVKTTYMENMINRIFPVTLNDRDEEGNYLLVLQ